MDQLSWSTDKPNPVNAAFMPLRTDKKKAAGADGDEAAMEDAMAAEVDEAADTHGQQNDYGGRGDGVIISMVSILLTLTEASRGANGIHWDPKVAPPCYLCETELKTEVAATVVDVMEAAEDEFPSKTAKMSAPSARQSSNTMPTQLKKLPKMTIGSAALDAAPTDGKEEVNVDSLGYWFRL
jgi:hypothetical protein